MRRQTSWSTTRVAGANNPYAEPELPRLGLTLSALRLTRWRIIDQLRKHGPPGVHRPEDRDAATGTQTTDKIVDPASQNLDELWEAEWQKALFDAAIAKVRRHVDPQKYQLFDFYVNQEWPAEKVAHAFCVPVEHVYLAKHRMTELIKEEVKRLEKEMT